jgi:phosphate transport system permease protein
MAVAVWAAVALVSGAFAWLLLDLIWHGAGHLSLGFLLESPADAGRAGGIAPMLASTGILLAVCLLFAAPLALGAALFLSEAAPPGSRLARGVSRSIDVLAAMPSIVFGLFGAAFFGQVLGLGFSLLSGGLTLGCMVLPILVRATEQGLRAVPDEVRRGAAALGLSRTSALARVIVPAAAPAMVVGLVLGIGRAAAETAALIFTSGYVDRMPESLFDSGRALSVHIYDLSMNVPGGDGNAYAAALVLLFALLVINGLTAWLSGRALSHGVAS